MIQDFLSEKSDSKEDLVLTLRSQSSKVVSILLDRIILVHMRLTLIYVLDLGLESPFIGFLKFSSNNKGSNF